MFVKTVKLRKPNPIAVVIILAAVLILIAVWVINSSGKGIGDKYKLPTNAERTTFLSKLGWQVSPKETDCKVIKIPSKFNTVYDSYNKLQKQQGFDLTKTKGKTVEIYTYEVYNYPNEPENIVAHLIICEGKLIGGDVCSIKAEGFIQGLMPTKKEGLKNSATTSETTAQDSTKKTNQAPATTDARTTQAPTTSKSPTGTTQAPASTKAPTGTTKAPASTTKSSAGTTKSSAGTTKAPGGTTKSPTPTTKAPTTNGAGFFFTT